MMPGKRRVNPNDPDASVNPDAVELGARINGLLIAHNWTPRRFRRALRDWIKDTWRENDAR